MLKNKSAWRARFHEERGAFQDLKANPPRNPFGQAPIANAHAEITMLEKSIKIQSRASLEQVSPPADVRRIDTDHISTWLELKYHPLLPPIIIHGKVIQT
jgi:hypothetical protein